MKTTFRLFVVCLVLTVGAGCAKTSVVVSEGGISVATEGPAFLYSMKDLREKAATAKDEALEACVTNRVIAPAIVLEACDAATKACNALKDFDPQAEKEHCSGVSQVCGSGPNLAVQQSVIEAVKQAATVAKTVAGLLPMRSFTLTVEADCNPADLAG